MQWKHFRDKITNWELWPFWLRYLGVAPAWLWYCLQSRSLWFFTASNPTITFGGFDGESKREIYEQMPPELYPKTIYIKPGEDEQPLVRKITASGFTYPFCVKPDVGLKGLLFRRIEDESALLQYHRQMEVAYLVQEWSPYALEVSVFYYRHPKAQSGTITGFIRKDLMEVIGNGSSTLEKLIAAHPIAKHRLKEMHIKHVAYLNQVLPKGERYLLAHAANLNRGARFSQLAQHVDASLLKLFDNLSHQTSFFYGRYDIKCASIEDLKNGKNFHILEYNGAGAEPNHVYHAHLRLREAHKEILRHWKAMFLISRHNHKQGHRYWPFWKGWRFLRQASAHAARLEVLDKMILP